MKKALCQSIFAVTLTVLASSAAWGGVKCHGMNGYNQATLTGEKFSFEGTTYDGFRYQESAGGKNIFVFLLEKSLKSPGTFAGDILNTDDLTYELSLDVRSSRTSVIRFFRDQETLSTVTMVCKEQ